MVKESKLRASRISGKKSLIRRADIELMMKTKPYERIMPKEDFGITEYYTAEEIAEKYKVNAKWVWTYTRQHKVPKVRIRQFNYYSKKHIDAAFAKYEVDSDLTEWYTPEEIQVRLTRELDKDVAILAGNDGAILTCLKEGGAGGIAGRANIWPETVAKIYDCFKAGDLEGAQAAQDAIAILQQTFKYGNPNTIIKTAVALQGHPVGKCRAPFNYVPEEGMEAIKKVLAENEAKGLH